MPGAGLAGDAETDDQLRVRARRQLDPDEVAQLRQGPDDGRVEKYGPADQRREGRKPPGGGLFGRRAREVRPYRDAVPGAVIAED